MQRKSKIFADLKTMFLNDKKAQLGVIEAKYMLYGLILGIIVTIVILMLANKGILPFKLAFVC